MTNFFDISNIPCFGVAGNFTGHLEQAGEAVDFKNIKTNDQNAPKAIFPTFIPMGKTAGQKDSSVMENTSPVSVLPAFLTVYPFNSQKIIFPKNEIKLQIEPECAIIFNASWQGEKLISLTPICFGASNDCSIR